MSTTTDMQHRATLTDDDRLVDAWLASLDGVAGKLRSGAMVADVGCGHGLSTILMARAFPRSAFTGYDPDAAALATAREWAQESYAVSFGGRNVRFEVAEAAAIPEYAFDLVTTFAALHDAADPLAVARQVRRAIAEDGTWMIGLGTHADLGNVSAMLGLAGFSRVRLALETASDFVLEARP